MNNTEDLALQGGKCLNVWVRISYAMWEQITFKSLWLYNTDLFLTQTTCSLWKVLGVLFNLSFCIQAVEASTISNIAFHHGTLEAPIPVINALTHQGLTSLLLPTHWPDLITWFKLAKKGTRMYSFFLVSGRRRPRWVWSALITVVFSNNLLYLSSFN